ncbi:MAG: glycosyltransferase, partial [Actinomycetota bacterium]|nr:glycosyltransferase [Actinomycetota bacterium]
MPDALLVTPIMPTAGGNGIAMRAGLYLEGLSRSFRVHCLVIPVFGGAGQGDGLVDHLAASASVLPLDRSPDDVVDLRARLAGPSSRLRATALHPRPRLCRSATLAAATAVAEAAEGVALVHVYRLYLAPFLDVLLDRPWRPVLTVDVDDLEDRVRSEMGDEAEAGAYRRLADCYLPAVDHMITTSPADAATLAGRYGRNRATAIPNAVRLPTFRPEPRSPTHDLVFVGTLSYLPNAEGARWLCEEVLPRLPGASVALVGSNPPEGVRALAEDSRVTVTGYVRDVAPWYGRARVAVVPLHAGGGTRIKVLEALAHNRPVVSTSVGAEGIDLQPGRDGMLVADGPPEFARACRTLLDDPELAGALASRGRDAVAARASVDVVSGRIAELFASLVATRSRAVALASQLRRNRMAADLYQRLHQGGVPAILLKGVSFATWLYDSPLDRPSSDVDLLIDPADELTAGEVLRALGFTSLYGRSRAILVGRPATVWTRGHDYVDLHRGRFWGIGAAPERSWAILRARTERLRVGTGDVTVLDPAARTLHVALHAVASGPYAHQQREDLRRAIEQVPLDVWREAAHLATALSAQPAFASALRLSGEGQALASRLDLCPHGSLESALFVDGPPPLADGLARLLAMPGAWPKVASAARALV